MRHDDTALDGHESMALGGLVFNDRIELSQLYICRCMNVSLKTCQGKAFGDANQPFQTNNPLPELNMIIKCVRLDEPVRPNYRFGDQTLQVYQQVCVITQVEGIIYH